jgi:hypothetical protein
MAFKTSRLELHFFHSKLCEEKQGVAGKEYEHQCIKNCNEVDIITVNTNMPQRKPDEKVPFG